MRSCPCREAGEPARAVMNGRWMNQQESRLCVYGESASFGFGPPGIPSLDAEAWYCDTHRQEGEQVWTARYRPSGEPKCCAAHSFTTCDASTSGKWPIPGSIMT